MKFYEGCTALITGASAGLGEEFARQLAPYAKKLVLVARRVDRLEVLKADLESLHLHLSVYIYGADLGLEDQRIALADWLPTQGIRVNFLVNNAGLGDHGLFESSEWSRVKPILDVNITALTHLTHLLLPTMLETGRGAILNVSSVASFFPLPNMAVYSATKAYVTGLSEALAMELRPKGITVTALCPGPVPTEFSQVATRAGEEDWKAHEKSMPIFVVTPEQAVRDGLEAVIKDRPRVIPNPILWLGVSLALILPFFITREVLRASSKKL